MSDDLKDPENKEEQPCEEPVDVTTDDSSEVEALKKQNEELLQTLGETKNLLKNQKQQFDKEITSLRDKLAEVEASLPKRSADEKMEVVGYYDFDSSHNRLINEEAETDCQRAFKDIKILNSYFR